MSHSSLDPNCSASSLVQNADSENVSRREGGTDGGIIRKMVTCS